MTDRLEIKAALSVDDAGTITGIAWPFGSPDRVGDVIEKGAIASPEVLPMLFAHDQAQVIGVWDQIEETPDGLTVKGRLLVDDVERAREVRAMIRNKAVSGLSIGFRTKSAKPRQRGRTITALDLHEISVVAVPSHPGAQITSVKAADGTADQKEMTLENEELELKNDPVISPEDLKALKADVATIKAKLARPTAANNNHPAAGNDNLECKAFGSYLRGGIERTAVDEAKALTIGSDANGGYLAPEEFGSELIKLLREYSPIRQYARVVNITASEIKYPRRVTGTAATWVAEIGDRTESGMTFEQVTLAPYELATFTDVSNQLLADNAYGLEGELLSDFAESFGITEGLAFVKGTGVGQPKGIMTATGIKEVKTGVAAAFPSTNPADVIIGMYHELATSHAANGVWIMNRKTLGTIRQWKDGTGRYLVLDPISAGGASTLLGRPIVEVPDMDDIGAGKYPILFGDLSGYRIVDRASLEMLRDPYTIKLKGQTRFHAWKRVGADVTHPDRFVKLKVSA
ncbi:phage prohead protease, HK97 family/phage major capsid protein, HK97 family,TIGR01554 [Rhizobium sp. RU20A]|uniref:phage major capsid protein n=1 Tax=Rhizobium sp. RU20A TaxID=1907412 RepID=UPI0009556700|nr:phage major capsid protein [Rhizobium sp. RU20A]SIP97022.1 phage prohead protease, HK97 family/phage major capsid protein, HK97 family,TIGR01554 [Rhizobium sp. RU20A]